MVSLGANIENTTAIISPDKNTLTVNVSDLSYPGAGVELYYYQQQLREV